MHGSPGHAGSPSDSGLEVPLSATEEFCRVRVRVLIIVMILVLATVGGLVVLGLNPPTPAPKAVEKVLPNDKFQTH
jgi:uncharacterized membrane protein YesL